MGKLRAARLAAGFRGGGIWSPPCLCRFIHPVKTLTQIQLQLPAGCPWLEWANTFHPEGVPKYDRVWTCFFSWKNIRCMKRRHMVLTSPQTLLCGIGIALWTKFLAKGGCGFVYTPPPPCEGILQILSATFTLRTSLKNARGRSNRTSGDCAGRPETVQDVL